MSMLFCDGFDKYGPANSNSTTVNALLTAGEWTTASGISITAPLSATGQAIATGSSAVLSKTLAGNYSRLIGGVRFSGALVASFGVQFLDAASNQCGISINTTGTIAVRNGSFSSGTILGTSTASVTANSTHYLEWDISFGNSNAYQLWLDGVSILTGTGDTTTTANNTASGLSFITGAAGVGGTLDDLYLFDVTGTTNNVVLLTSPRIETTFPISDSSVQFANGAGMVGDSLPRLTTSVSGAANQLRLRAVVPGAACTLTSISLIAGSVTSATINHRPVVYADSGGAPGALLGSGSAVTGTTAGTTKTMPLTSGVSLSAGTTYWIGHMADIVLTSALREYESASTDRTVVSTFASGAPGTAPAMVAGQSTVIWGTVTVVGTNWSAASHQPPQGALSYVYDATVNHEDLYNFTPLSAPPATVHAVALKAYTARSDSGAKTVSLRMKSGGTDSGGTSTGQTPATTFGWLASYFPTDPNTSAAWTGTNLDAATAGLKVDS